MQHMENGDESLSRKLIPVCLCAALILSSVGTFAGCMNTTDETAEKNALGGLWNPEGPTESATAHIVQPEEVFAAHPGPLPSSVDNSAGLPPVGNQQSQGSCTCWAIGYYHATYIENQESAFDLEDPNNQASPAFLYNVADGGYNGGSYMEDVADLIISNGVPSMSEVPYDQYDYTSWPAHDWIWVSGMKRKAVSQNWLDMTQTTGMAALKAYLAAGNTATTGIEVWSNFDYIENFRNTYCSSERYGTDRGGHIVTICGYDDTMPTADGSGALRMVNSWGTGWGEAGYWWMSYGAVMDSLICYGWSMYLESELNYEPKVVAKVQINHDARGDITRNHGLSVTVYENSVETMSKSFLCCYWIDDWYGTGCQQHPFPAGKMAFDISEALSNIDPALEHSFVLSMTNWGGLTGELISYEILNAEYWEGDISWETPLSVGPYVQTSTEASVYPGWFVHLPIRINSNLDMEQQAIGEFWVGDGTELDPYVLPDYYIWGENWGNCIFIGNTTSGFVIKNCTVEGASGAESSDYYLDSGIYLYSVSGGAISGNNASGNALGIYAEGCAGSLVEWNNVDSNAYGIVFSGCNNMVMRMNDVERSAYYGVYLEASSDVLVYHNNFLNNTVQAGDGSGLNEWDGSYPSGGNYWSDYSGIDMMSGPLQNQPGSDGIGDTPYTNIDGGMGAQDNYPLMEPWNEESQYTPHLPIRINSNADFDEAHGVMNWDTGNGTEGNPWVIQRYDINATNYGCAIYIGNTTDYFIIRDCHLHDASGMQSSYYYMDSGIRINNAENGCIDHCAITRNRYGLYIFWSCNNHMIANNSITNNSLYNIYMRDCINTCIEYNIIESSGRGILSELGFDYNTIRGNKITFHNIGIQLSYATENIIVGNNISSNSQRGIFFTQDSHHNTISNNSLFDNDEGIVLAVSSNNVVKNNTCANNGDGIVLYNSDPLNVLDGNIVSNNVRGIYCTGGGATNCQIVNNTLSANSQGLYLSSSGNLVFNNTVTANQYGIYSTSYTSNNIIHHNNLIENVNQAYDQGVNFWDNGYPSGGNYWSDYSGSDSFSGPGQDIPGADGIGDTPYTNIQGGSGAQDNYPLMELWTPPTPELFNINLTTGWNLISIPLETADTSVESILSSISGTWDAVKYYDSIDHMDPWKSFRPAGTVNDLAYLDRTMGVWVHATGNCTLTVEGQIPASTGITLHAGWNLVGFPSFTGRVMSDALWGTSADCVEVFDPADPELLRAMGPGENMVPGQGYWVHVVADTVWTVDW